MIIWTPDMGGGYGSGTDAPREVSLINGLIRLAETMVRLDATDPETDSIGFDVATDRVITAARHVVTAAKPVTDHPGGLEAAVRDAVTARRDRARHCRDCGRAGACGDHAANHGWAELYRTLLPTVRYEEEPEPPTAR
ncbi:hypothetical protein DPM19_12030 [Actinomadura craniellae]|uniref:Uncharacterized protein n=1 Tax=Actinomadura craniellae TaxID=2231787 RepID=A0A365H8I3_9ACTN|nr:hypothetical protein [Actinomadura craniellae]RAY15415.1 hypothetical protein DPM19_12030 [Actinomadura craniellae]